MMSASDRQPVGAPSPIQITVDNSPGSAEPRQPDSGSNQSGSDSGLGCSNSISSDNSTTINQPTHQASAQNWDSCPLDVNNNDTAATNKSKATITPLSKSDLVAIDEAGTTCTSETNFHQQQQPSRKTPAALTSFLPTNNALEQTIKPESALDGQHVQPTTAKSTIKSLLKKSSHLSKAHGPVGTDLESDPNQTKVTKHNRSVSFNQTVIVFCEDLETPPSNEHFQSQVESSASSFEPPLDYCDVGREILDSHKPRDDLAQSDAHSLATTPKSSNRGSTATKGSAATVILGHPDAFVKCVKPNDEQLSSRRRNEQAEDADDDYDEEEDYDHDDEDTNLFEQEDNAYANTYVNIGANRTNRKGHRSDALLDTTFYQLGTKKGVQNLTNDQIVGLLEDENLLEAFKLNFDDLSESDFPINHLTSGHGYLCDGAISDYDSDSESSYCRNDSKDIGETAKNPQGDAAKSRQNHQPSRPLENKEVNTKHEEVNLKNPQKGVPTVSLSKYQQSNSGSLPARVKVSTVDNSQIKKSTSSRDDTDLKLRNVTKSAIDISHSSKSALVRPVLGSGRQNTTHQIPWEHSTSTNSVRDRLIPTETRTGYSINKAQALIDSAQPNTAALRPAAQSRCSESADQNQQTRSLSPHLNAFPPPPQPLLPSNQPVLTQPTCHMCRAIETSRSQSNLNNVRPTTTDGELPTISLAGVSQPNKFMTLVNQSQPQIVAPNQAAPIFNQSCLSCREASVQQRQYSHAAQPAGSVLDQAQAKPMTYQVLNLIDQNGNRIRALSIIRPGTNGLNQNLIAGKRYVLAQPGTRLTNPSSIQGGNLQQQQHQQPSFISNGQSNPSMQNQARFRLLSSTPVSAAASILNSNQQQVSASAHIGRMVASNQSVRQPGVYYVRQPLDTQSIRHVNSGAAPRSFPDPHEVRRLDGIRAPTIPTARIEQQDFLRKPKSVIEVQPSEHHHYDDNDDPTFGFSKRPAVKVVATNSSSGINLNQLDSCKSQLELSRSNSFIGNRLKQMTLAGPAHVSQILGGRLTDQKAFGQEASLSTNSATSKQNNVANQGNRHLLYQQTGITKLEDQKGKGTVTTNLRRWFKLKRFTADA